MTDHDKPRICQVLGVEVGEKVSYVDQNGEEIGLEVLEDGNVNLTFKGGMRMGWAGTGYAIVQAINHPDRIIRKPRFTEEEVADAREIVRIFGHNDVIKRTDDNALCYGQIIINSSLLPSVRPGQPIAISDIVCSKS